MANAILSLVSAGEDTSQYEFVNITKSPSSGTYLNFSTYVKDYNNIVAILWMGCDSDVANAKYSLYSEGFTKKAIKEGWENPQRILALSPRDFSIPYACNPCAINSNYLCFKPEEWEAGGNIGVYSVNYQGVIGANPYTKGYGNAYIYLVYKKEESAE